MMRLWCDFEFHHLGYLFDISDKTASRCFHIILKSLDIMFQHELFGLNEHAKESMRVAKPLPCFKKFPHMGLVLDCTEVFMQHTGQSEIGKLFWSDYKKHHTVKILVGINSAGRVAFVSTCKPGKISDKHITDVSKVLKYIPEGWTTMVDKGFLIDDLAGVHDIKVVRPPFLPKNKQFTVQQANLGADIAQARIHVERVIQRAKRFRIVSHQILNSTMPYISTLVKVCFALVNLTGDCVIDK